MSNTELQEVQQELQALKTINEDLHAQLNQAERLASIGRMAASIAHEIKNPLVSIKALSDLMPKMWENAIYREKYVEIIGPQINRINDLCQSLLRFGKPVKADFALVNLKKIIQEVLTLLEGERKRYRAVFVAKLCDDDLVIVDYNQISQVVLNLVMNALQALKADNDGQITIQTHLTLSGFICLEIIDNGCGIEPESISKLFDLYYTSKLDGTGLGLSIVRKIIEEHKGKILVASKLAEGTTFSVYLPTDTANMEKLIEEELGS